MYTHIYIYIQTDEISIVLEAPIPKMSLGDTTSLYVIYSETLRINDGFAKDIICPY